MSETREDVRRQIGSRERDREAAQSIGRRVRFKPSPENYRREIGKLTAALIEDPSNRAVQLALRAICEAAKADKSLEDLAKLKTEIAEMKKMLRDVAEGKSLAVNPYRATAGNVPAAAGDDAGLPIQ